MMRGAFLLLLALFGSARGSPSLLLGVCTYEPEALWARALRGPLCTTLLTPVRKPEQVSLWPAHFLSGFCTSLLRAAGVHQPPEPQPSPSMRLWASVSASASRVAHRTLRTYTDFLQIKWRAIRWVLDILRVVVRHLASSWTFRVGFAAALCAELARRRWQGPNVVAAIEHFIDEYVRHQRYAIHQILFISWLLSGSWSEVYSFVRDLAFTHVSALSWAIFSTRAVMWLVDALRDFGPLRRSLVSAVRPYAVGLLFFLSLRLGMTCLGVEVFREATLVHLGRDPTSDTTGVIELAVELLAAPTARACGTTLGVALFAELWSVAFCVLFHYEMMRLLTALGRLEAARQLRAEVTAKQSAYQASRRTLRRDVAVTPTPANRLEMAAAEAMADGWGELISRAHAVEEQAMAQLAEQTLPLFRPIAESLIRAFRVLPSSSFENYTKEEIVAQSCRWKLRVLSACVVFPSCTLVSALVVHSVSTAFEWVWGLLLRLAARLWRLLASWDSLWDLLNGAYRSVMQCRAQLQAYQLLLLLLPATVWLGLRLYMRPEQTRRVFTKAYELATGRGHQTRCLARMLFRRPVARYEPEAGDTCPICLDELDEGELAFCLWGCGRPVHTACMDSWRSHRNAIGMTECLTCKAWM
jgi:hypothetical protein